MKTKKRKVKGKTRHSANVLVSGMLPLLRELTMRSQIAFPENEQDEKWFDEGIDRKRSDDFMERLWHTLKLDSGNYR